MKLQRGHLPNESCESRHDLVSSTIVNRPETCILQIYHFSDLKRYYYSNEVYYEEYICQTQDRHVGMHITIAKYMKKEFLLPQNDQKYNYILLSRFTFGIVPCMCFYKFPVSFTEFLNIKSL